VDLSECVDLCGRSSLMTSSNSRMAVGGNNQESSDQGGGLDYART
jgi:hypothetical protein